MREIDLADPAFARRKGIAVAALCLCEVLAMTLWFAAAAIVPALDAEFGLSPFQKSMMASTVSLGFVAGTLVSAGLGLADRFDSRRLFALSATAAALTTLALLRVPADSWGAPALRLVTGMAMAGVYPLGMRMMSTWARRDTGLLVGLLVGALTLGTAAPHLIDALGGLDWRLTLKAAGGLALVSAALVPFVELGPAHMTASDFRAHHALRAWRDKALRLTNLGYFGHMWELYALWAWLGVFLGASFAIDPGGPDAALLARYVTFAAIAMGVLGCIAGGLFADRLGRTATTIAALAVSGACAAASPLIFGADPWLVGIVCVIWGIAVIADSAQFSAGVIELSPPELRGTMLTVQTSLGFLLTVFAVHAVPEFAAVVGWRYAFLILVIGPVMGIVAMLSLRRHPDSVKMAGGRR